MNEKNKQAVVSSLIAGLAGMVAVFAPLSFVHSPHTICISVAVGVFSFVVALATTYYPE